MAYLKYTLGVDVSKDKLQTCLVSIDDHQQVEVQASRKFANRLHGFKQLIEWLDKQETSSAPVVITMEATGVYYEQLAWFLYNQGYDLSVILPSHGKRYINSLGLTSKNDKIDAQGLATMGAQRKLPKWEPLSPQIYEIRSLTRHYQKLQEQKTAVSNALHTFRHSAHSSSHVIAQKEEQLALLDKQLEATKKSIEKCIDEDKKMAERIDKICRIRGLSRISVATVIAETNGFALFSNQRQVVSYAGYDVIENQSGKRVGKTKISKQGNSRIRRILHMPSLNVVQFEQEPFLSLYERVYKRTKVKMKGYVAVQRKLLVFIYALWKKNEAFDPDYHKSEGEKEVDEPASDSSTQDRLQATYCSKPSFEFVNS